MSGGTFERLGVRRSPVDCAEIHFKGKGRAPGRMLDSFLLMPDAEYPTFDFTQLVLMLVVCEG